MTINDLNTGQYQDSVIDNESDLADEDEVDKSLDELDKSKSSGYTDLVCGACGGTIWLIDNEYICGHCRRKGYPNYDYENEFFYDEETFRTNLTSIDEQTKVTKSKKNKKRNHK